MWMAANDKNFLHMVAAPVHSYLPRGSTDGFPVITTKSADVPSIHTTDYYDYLL